MVKQLEIKGKKVTVPPALKEMPEGTDEPAPDDKAKRKAKRKARKNAREKAKSESPKTNRKGKK